MSKRHKVIVADFIADALAPERSVLGEIADVVALNATDEKEMVGKVEDAGALMVYHAIFRLSGGDNRQAERVQDHHAVRGGVRQRRAGGCSTPRHPGM